MVHNDDGLQGKCGDKDLRKVGLDCFCMHRAIEQHGRSGCRRRNIRTKKQAPCETSRVAPVDESASLFQSAEMPIAVFFWAEDVASDVEREIVSGGGEA